MTAIPHNSVIRPGARAAGLVLAAALVFPWASAAWASQFADGVTGTALAGAPADHPLPQVKTHAPFGFRLYRPGYRLAGNGALVSAQLCRLPGWAAGGPQHLRVERLDRNGLAAESHELYLPRLGMRIGNNCRTIALRLDAVPSYGETIKICAISGGGTCP